MPREALLALASLPEDEYREDDLKKSLTSTALESVRHLIPPQKRGVIKWTLENRLNVAVEAIRSGVHIDEIAKTIGWKAFEALTEAVFRAWSYTTQRNYRLGRREIDIIAKSSDMTFVVECKRWRKPAGQAVLSQVTSSLVEKAEVLAAKTQPNETLIPIVVTMQRYTPKIVHGIPIVPIGVLQDFLENLPQYVSELTKLTVRRRAAKTS